MNMFIDREKLTALLRDLYLLTGFRVGVFDTSYRTVAVYPEEHGEYCRLLQDNPRAQEQCDACDREACTKSRNLGKMVVYCCHAGLGEAVLPLYYENTVIGYVIMGEIRQTGVDPKKLEEVWRRLESYGVDVQTLKDCYYHKPIVSDEVARAAVNVLQASAASLYKDGMITVRDLSIAERLDAFLEENLSAPLSVEMLCSALSISKARLYALFEKRYGMGVAEHIRQCRLRKAKSLLTGTTLPIAEVVSQCGFSDYNYFSKVFKRYCGVSPRDYRKAQGIDDAL